MTASGDEDDGDNAFVPASLKQFLADAESRLQETTEDVLQQARKGEGAVVDEEDKDPPPPPPPKYEDYKDHSHPKAVPDPLAHVLSDGDDDDDIFHNILQQESDLQLRATLGQELSGAPRPPPVLASPSGISDVTSPSCFPPSTKNANNNKVKMPSTSGLKINPYRPHKEPIDRDDPLERQRREMEGESPRGDRAPILEITTTTKKKEKPQVTHISPPSKPAQNGSDGRRKSALSKKPRYSFTSAKAGAEPVKKKTEASSAAETAPQRKSVAPISASSRLFRGTSASRAKVAPTNPPPPPPPPKRYANVIRRPIPPPSADKPKKVYPKEGIPVTLPGNRASILASDPPDPPSQTKRAEPAVDPPSSAPAVTTVSSWGMVSKENGQSSSKPNETQTKPRPPPKPSKPPPRWMASTAASTRKATSTAPSMSTTQRRRTVSSLSTSASDRQAAEERVRNRIEAQKAKKQQEAERIQAQIEQRKQEQQERKQRMQTALQRAKDKRIQLEQQEKDRLLKIKQQMEEKQARARNAGKALSIGAHSEALVKGFGRPPPKPTPTIPVSPDFATQRRLGPVPKKKTAADDVSSLASSTDILKRGLRDSSSVASSTAPQRRTLTIPQTPKFATDSRLGSKKTVPGIVSSLSEDSGDGPGGHGWEDALRISSTPPSDPKPRRLTIPETPQFQPITKRPLPKSTAEQEEELMQHYQAHPFHARPIRMNEAPKPSSRPPPPKRPLTLPEPFSFRIDDRLSHKENRPQQASDSESSFQQFKARPMPDYNLLAASYSSSSSSNVKSRRLTMPEPFVFGTSKHRRASEPLEPIPLKPRFRARPMPNFGGSRMIIHSSSRRGSGGPEAPPSKGRYSLPYQDDESTQFKARPMPKQLSSPPAIPVKKQDPTRLRGSPRKHDFDEKKEEPMTTPFKALPLPDFSKPAVPVRSELPIKLRSPSSVVKKPLVVNDTSPAVSPFKARPAPDFSKPFVPVKQPPKPLALATPTRSTDEEGDHATKPKLFHAKPLPDLVSPPAIPVRMQDPKRLRTPASIQKPTSTTTSSPVQAFKARPMPNFERLQQKWASPDPQGTSPVRKAKVSNMTPTTAPPVASATSVTPKAGSLSSRVRVSQSTTPRGMSSPESTRPSTNNASSGTPKTNSPAKSPSKIPPPAWSAKKSIEKAKSQDQGQSVDNEVVADLGFVCSVPAETATASLKEATEAFLANSTACTAPPPPVTQDKDALRAETIRLAQDIERAAQDELSFGTRGRKPRPGSEQEGHTEDTEQASSSMLNRTFNFWGKG